MAKIQVITGLVLGAGIFLQTVNAGIPPICPFDTPVSCQNKTVVAPSCCFSSPGGQLLLTQLWDTNPSTGPDDSWTIHGLWPDNCDGSYQSGCDAARQYTNITDIIRSFNRYDLSWFMNRYWLNGEGTGFVGDENSFYAHEWGKHGTCLNTLNPSCYHAYRPQEEVVDYFQRAIQLFIETPTYRYLAAANIYPSATKNYTYDQVLAALTKPRGANATLECNARGELYSVYYTYNVQGSIANGRFVPAQPVGQGVGCPSSFRYLPKSSKSSAYA